MDGGDGVKNGMYKTKCAYCGKEMHTFAKDKIGTLPVVYCPGKVCESNAKYERRFKK